MMLLSQAGGVKIACFLEKNTPITFYKLSICHAVRVYYTLYAVRYTAARGPDAARGAPRGTLYVYWSAGGPSMDHNTIYNFKINNLK